MNTLRQLIVEYTSHSHDYYRSPSGQPTGEVTNIREALNHLTDFLEHDPSTFSASMLRLCRDRMIDSGRLARPTINARVNRIRRMFRWAVSHELIPSAVLVSLSSVEPLKLGRSKARETQPVHPVSWELVCATLSVVRHPVDVMIELQWWTGMRPGEVVQMTRSTLDRSSDVWLYHPPHHKTLHHGYRREIPIGPQAQSVLARVLGAPVDSFLFPELADDVALFPLTRNGYYNHIRRACLRHRLTPWSPNQLRHSAATRLRREVGIEAARVILGHSSPATTEIYAEIDRSKAVQLMHRFG